MNRRLMNLTPSDMFDEVFDLETHALEALESEMDQVEEGSLFEADFCDEEDY